MAGFLDQIEPLKQAALAELRAAPDLPTLEQARVNNLGANGKFTALMKQLGALSKEEKPAAGKAINSAKVALEAALAQRRRARPRIPLCPGTAKSPASSIRWRKLLRTLSAAFARSGSWSQTALRSR